QYVITDKKNLPGKMCSAAILAHKGAKVTWNPLPNGYPVKGKSVTISLFTAPNGFELPPKSTQTPVYFAVNCYK
ncbi:MAG: hypothetical protein JO104_01060, partial [Candidatus Eremiobacteraeota bacterium]|nr:hypothetical protein [Candidatus Eremiobacteraeota bacterium]